MFNFIRTAHFFSLTRTRTHSSFVVTLTKRNANCFEAFWLILYNFTVNRKFTNEQQQWIKSLSFFTIYIALTQYFFGSSYYVEQVCVVVSVAGMRINVTGIIIMKSWHGMCEIFFNIISCNFILCKHQRNYVNRFNIYDNFSLRIIQVWNV